MIKIKQTLLLCHWMILLKTIRKYRLFFAILFATLVLSTVVCDFVCDAGMVLYSDYSNSHFERPKQRLTKAHQLLTKDVACEYNHGDSCYKDGMTKFFESLSLSSEPSLIEVSANGVALFSKVTPDSFININTAPVAGVTHTQFLYGQKVSYKRVLLNSFQI